MVQVMICGFIRIDLWSARGFSQYCNSQFLYITPQKLRNTNKHNVYSMSVSLDITMTLAWFWSHSLKYSIIHTLYGESYSSHPRPRNPQQSTKGMSQAQGPLGRLCPTG